MVALIITALFPLALLAALGTIVLMISTHGAKMLAALKMEHVPATEFQEILTYRSRGYSPFRSGSVRPVLDRTTALPHAA
jgi:hypothetical protein